MNSFNTRGGNFLSSIPQVTRFLLIANVALFLFDMLSGGMLKEFFQLNPYHRQFYTPVLTFKPYQFITHMFMHGGLLHLLFNMFFGLYMFGRIIESSIGSKQYFILYFLSGLGAAGLQFAIQYAIQDPIPMVGASGAIMGVVASFAVLYPNQELMIFPLPLPVKAKYLIPGFMLMSIFMGIRSFSWDNIAHFAHLGGAIVGAVYIFFWKRNRFKNY